MAGGLYLYGKIDDVFPFGIGANDTSGSGDDGASPTAYVRKVGDGAGVAPIHEPTPTLLTHVNYPAGCYALEITASVANGYANGEKYLVYTSLAVDAQNPTGAVGGFELSADGGLALRGPDGDSLKDISDKIGDVKAKTDNLPETPKKNTAFPNPYQFFMEDLTGTGVPGLTVTGIRILDGNKTGIGAPITEVAGGGGWYQITPLAGDTNGDHVAHQFSTVTAGVKDSIVEFWTST